MLTILADALLTATRIGRPSTTHRDSLWEGRFLPQDRRSEYQRRRARIDGFTGR